MKDVGAGSDGRIEELYTNIGFRRRNYGGSMSTSHGEDIRRRNYGGIGENERISM
jgi:hypothetical protein